MFLLFLIRLLNGGPVPNGISEGKLFAFAFVWKPVCSLSFGGGEVCSVLFVRYLSYWKGFYGLVQEFLRAK